MLYPNLTTVILQIVNFVVLSGLLYLLFFKPVMKQVRTRIETKERMMAQLARDQAEATRLRVELEKRMADLDDETAQIISFARERAETERIAVLRQAQDEVEHILVEAEMDSYRIREQAVQEFHDQILDAVLSISAQIIGRAAPPDLHERMVKQLCDHVWDLGRREIARVDAFRRSLGERTPTVTVNSALPLSPDMQSLLVRTFSALADRTPRLELRLDPTLSLGIRVRVGDIMIDNSIAGQLAEMREQVSQDLREQLKNE